MPSLNRLILLIAEDYEINEPRALSAAEKMSLRLSGAAPLRVQRAPVNVDISAYKKEIADYLLYMDSAQGRAHEEPLAMWSLISGRFPVLARFARRVLCISATSADVERLFSHAGDVCTPDRSQLTADKINMLVTCNLYLRRKLSVQDKRNIKSAARVGRFAQLGVDRILQVNKEDYEAYIDDEDAAVDPDYGGNDSDEDDD